MNAFALFLATFSGIAIGSVLLAEYDARGRPEKNTVPEGNIKKWDLYTKVTASLLLATGVGSLPETGVYCRTPQIAF